MLPGGCTLPGNSPVLLALLTLHLWVLPQCWAQTECSVKEFLPLGLHSTPAVSPEQVLLVPLPMRFSIFLEGKGCRSSLSQGQLPCRDFLQMLPLELHLGPGNFPEHWVLCLEGAGWAVGDEVRPEMRPHGSEEQRPRFPGVISFPSPPPTLLSPQES